MAEASVFDRVRGPLSAGLAVLAVWYRESFAVLHREWSLNRMSGDRSVGEHARHLLQQPIRGSSYVGTPLSAVLFDLVEGMPAGKALDLAQASPVEGFMVELKLALLASIFLASPFIFRELWRFISPGLYAPNHQHFFCVRMDMAVDGPLNTVVEVDSQQILDERDALKQKLMTDVKDVVIRVLSNTATSLAAGPWLQDWPASGVQANTLPRALEVTIQTEDYGEMKRLFPLLAGEDFVYVPKPLQGNNANNNGKNNNSGRNEAPQNNDNNSNQDNSSQDNGNNSSGDDSSQQQDSSGGVPNE